MVASSKASHSQSSKSDNNGVAKGGGENGVQDARATLQCALQSKAEAMKRREAVDSLDIAETSGGHCPHRGGLVARIQATAKTDALLSISRRISSCYQP